MSGGLPDDWFRSPKYAPPEKDRKEKKERLLSPVKIGAGALASVTAAFLSSLLGNGGTLIGVALASTVTGAGATLYEHAAHRATEHAAKRSSTLLGRQAAYKRRPSFLEVLRELPYHTSLKIMGIAIGGAALVATTAFGTITVVEKLSGRTLHGITTGTRDGGTTLGGGSSTVPVHHRHRRHHHHPRPPSTSLTPSVSPSPSTSPSVRTTLVPSLSPIPTPAPSSTSVSPSASPSANSGGGLKS